MSDALLRQWRLLQLIPRAPARIDVSAMESQLRDAGHRMTRRTVQRDLEMLSGLFPLHSEQVGVRIDWSWEVNAAAFDLPPMDGTAALALTILQQVGGTMLPPVVHDSLRPQFHRAREVLKQHRRRGLRNWADAVRMVPRELAMLPPAVNEDAVRAVYQGLLEGRRVSMRYARRTDDATREGVYTVSPLGLVARGAVMYLVCTVMPYKDVRQFALHRVREATMTDLPVQRPKDFNLDRYIQDGEFQYPVGGLIRVELAVSGWVATHLGETPLSADQTISVGTGDERRVQATVVDSQQLLWWLSSMGDDARVIAPKSLRERLKRRLRAALAAYEIGGGDG